MVKKNKKNTVKKKEKRVWECILLGKEEAERRARIRRREKYKFWERVYQVLKKTKSQAEVMRLIFECIDERNGWQYASQAVYAEEALDLFLEDHNLVKKRR